MAELRALSAEDAGPVPEVVALLEKTLEQARRGEVIAVGLATVNTREITATAWEQGPAALADLHFAAATLQARLMGSRVDLG